MVRAYVPPPLPPVPPLELASLLERLSAADRALGRLDGISRLLPNKELFLYMYVRKEAVLSSQIEGTQSTLNDLLRFESDATEGVPIDDIREVSNYVSAMMHGLERMKTLPLSLRLIREMHSMLLDSGRGAGMAPGEFRTTQNWIGGTRSRQRCLCATSTSFVDAVPRPIREIHSRRNAVNPATDQGWASACPV